MSPATVVILVAALCLAVLGYALACGIVLSVAAINQGAFTWANQPDPEA